MKPFLFLIGLVVLAAIAAPFFLTIKGQALMTVDEVLDDATPNVMKTKTQIYRWQDEHGVWQFGEEPPANTSTAESVEIEDKITGLSRDWHGGGGRPERCCGRVWISGVPLPSQSWYRPP